MGMGIENPVGDDLVYNPDLRKRAQNAQNKIIPIEMAGNKSQVRNEASTKIKF
jgi:hypothetical protein